MYTLGTFHVLPSMLPLIRRAEQQSIHVPTRPAGDLLACCACCAFSAHEWRMCLHSIACGSFCRACSAVKLVNSLQAAAAEAVELLYLLISLYCDTGFRMLWVTCLDTPLLS